MVARQICKWAWVLWFILSVNGLGCRRDGTAGKTGHARKSMPADAAWTNAHHKRTVQHDGGAPLAQATPRPAGLEPAGRMSHPAARTDARAAFSGDAAREQALTAADLKAYATKWRTLARTRARLKGLLRQASSLQSAENAAKVGALITNSVVPEFERLIRALRMFKPSTVTLSRAHKRIVAGYSGMLDAYRLAGRAWRSSGQGVALALRRLRQARRQLRTARRQLDELARQHQVRLE